jgi:Uma2 family endonuclease
MPAPAASIPHYSWNDYQSWPDGERWEIIGGVAYNMSPAPSTRHQMAILKFAAKLEQALSGKPCRPHRRETVRLRRGAARHPGGMRSKQNYPQPHRRRAGFRAPLKIAF